LICAIIDLCHHQSRRSCSYCLIEPLEKADLSLCNGPPMRMYFLSNGASDLIIPGIECAQNRQSRTNGANAGQSAPLCESRTVDLKFSPFLPASPPVQLRIRKTERQNAARGQDKRALWESSGQPAGLMIRPTIKKSVTTNFGSVPA
jgi:hypothetical protein